VLNIFRKCKITSQNRFLNINQGGREILEDLEADGKCRIPEQNLMDPIHEVRRRRRRTVI
jgi:hypothetical protein